ncbi:MAG TPA: glycosyltransferase [Acidimicrobiales bacterium]|nr:glycosyltransferase [Acidimicrobiales bacterium]
MTPAPPAASNPPDGALRILVVGPSYRFASGISAYTHRLSHALAERHEVSVLLLRRLVPRRFYPGSGRVGHDLSFPSYRRLSHFDGIDWYWGPSLVGGIRFMRRSRPQVVLLQWWTLAALHTYLALALLARLGGTPVVIEFHEVQDPAEQALTGARRLNRLGLSLLVRSARAVIAHSDEDLRLVRSEVDLGPRPAAVIGHGPYDHLVGPEDPGDMTAPPSSDTRLLFFGLIRPYKGVEDLVEAFGRLPEEEAAHFRLTIVGETWEGWTRPAESIRASHYSERIRFVNRYVPDDEVGRYFRDADALVLPYRRASSSGPLNIALAAGLPVVLYDVAALVKAVEGYEGAIIVAQGDIDGLGRALGQVRSLGGRRFTPRRGWAPTVGEYTSFLNEVIGR